MIPESFIAEVLGRTDIVALINDGIGLRRAGSSFKALCPFHHESTPSFFVVPRLQIYKCHGCGASGDAIKWLMESEGLEFREAVAELATRAGLALPEEAFAPMTDTQRRERAASGRVQATVKRMHEFFQEQLRASAAAQNYLIGRGMDQAMIERSQVGYAPERYRVAGFSGAELVQAGVAVRSEGKTTWLFRDRIIFPIWNRKRQVVAFGGRRMGERGPKYLNSQETSLYNKSTTLSGLGRIASSARSVCLVEGYMDELMLNLHDIAALGTCGTALTDQQAELLVARHGHIVLLFDGDEAGRRATLNAALTLLPRVKARTRLSVLAMPDGVDPDEIVVREGADAFRARIANAPDLVDAMFDRLPLGTTERATALEDLRAVVEQMPAGVLREMLCARLAQQGVSTARKASGRARPAPPPMYFTLSTDLRMVALLLHWPDLARSQACVADLMPEPARSIARAFENDPLMTAAGISRLLSPAWRAHVEPLLQLDLSGIGGIDVEATYLEACREYARNRYLETQESRWRDVHKVMTQRLDALDKPHEPTSIQCLVDGVKSAPWISSERDEDALEGDVSATQDGETQCH